VSDDPRASEGLFKFNPSKSTYVACFGPKNAGKSELIQRFFASYPYNGLLMDITGDADPDHDFTLPIPPALRELAVELGSMSDPSIDSMYDFRARVRQAWLNDGEYRFAKYRVEPSYLPKDWLERSDDFIGLAYLMGYCFDWLDEINDEAPANQTPRWTRQSLRVGRHEHLFMGMAGPRPANLDPNVLNQADIVTIHGQLHQIDVKRMAQQLSISEADLFSLMRELVPEERDGIEVSPFLVYEKKTRSLYLVPALPPRPAPRPAAVVARR